MGEYKMFETLLEYSTQWKDFFWIIFTLVATITSILTYLQVKKSIRQPLYNKVIESQMDIFTRLLELLKESPEAFIFSCDFDLLIKYNLISHCVHFGCFEGQEVPERIYAVYMAQKREKQIDGTFDLENILRDIESITIYGSNEINRGEIYFDETKNSDSKEGNKEDIDIGVYKLLNIRGALFQTPSFQHFHKELQLCMNNIYLPKRLSKRLISFHNALLDVLLVKMAEIIRREEEKVLNAECGEEIIINFDSLFNEILKSCKALMKEHELVRKEIRRLLKIDVRW